MCFTGTVNQSPGLDLIGQALLIVSMRRLLLLTISLALLSGCAFHPFGLFKHKLSTNISVNPVGVTNATVDVSTAAAKVKDQAAGYNVAATTITNTLPDGVAKAGLKTVLEGQSFLLGPALPTTQDTFTAWALQLISADAAIRAKATADAQTYESQSKALRSQLETLKLTQANELAKLKDAHALELANAAAEADAHVKTIVSFIFFGLAALLVLGAIATAVLASSYPLFGPKAAIGFGMGGLLSGATGVAIIKLMDVSVIYWGIGLIVLCVAGALILIGSNHNHATTVAATNGPKL